MLLLLQGVKHISSPACLAGSLAGHYHRRVCVHVCVYAYCVWVMESLCMSMGAYVAVLTRLTTSMHCSAQLAQVLDIMRLYQMTVSLTLSEHSWLQPRNDLAVGFQDCQQCPQVCLFVFVNYDSAYSVPLWISGYGHQFSNSTPATQKLNILLWHYGKWLTSDIICDQWCL